MNDEKTRKREIEGLMEAMNAYGLAEGYSLTMEEKEELEIDGKQKRCIVTVAGDTIANGQLCKKLIIAYQDNPNEKRVFAAFVKDNKIYGEFGSSTNLLIDFK